MTRARLTAEPLEDRATPAAFLEAGGVLTLDLDTAAERVAVVSNGTAYALTLTGGTWSGTDSANVTGDGTAGLTVTPAGLAAFAAVRVTDSAPGTVVAFLDSGANGYADDFDVALDGGSAGVTFSGATAFGASSLSVLTDRSIAVASGAAVTTSAGSLTLAANGQGTPTSGDFVGVDVNHATVGSTGSGTVLVRGRGGDAAGGSQFGVGVRAGGVITGGSTGTLRVEGTGGSGGGSANAGVLVTDAGSAITTAGGAVAVTGVGGGIGSAFENHGVRVAAGGTITADGSGAVGVLGTGGAAGGTNNYGVEVVGSGAAITSDGGPVSVTGRGGGASGSWSNYGILLQVGGTISGGGTVRVEGTGGGGGGNGSLNVGVYVIDSGSAITSAGGPVAVTGWGGGSGAGFENQGVRVAAGGTITADGSGAVGVLGTGGAAGGTNNYGVEVVGSGALITASGGPVSVTGRGGGTSGSWSNYGILLQVGGTIVGGGTGSLTVAGFGGGGGGGGSNNVGVYVIDSGSAITAGGGPVAVTGTSPDSDDIRVTNAAVGSGAGGLTLTADTLALTGTATVSGTGPLAVRPRTPSASIGLGGGGGTLNLDDGELAALQNGFTSIAVGVPGGTGVVTVDTATFADPVTVTGGVLADATDAGTDVTADGLTLDGPVAPGGDLPGVFSVAGGLTLPAGAALVIRLDGPAAGTGYDQVAVTGAVVLGGATLTVSGPFAPAIGSQFRVVENDGADPVVGTFAGLPEGAVVTAGGRAYRLTYAGGDGNDVVLTRINIPPTANPDAVTTAEDTAVAFDPRGNDADADGDALTVTAVTQGAHGAVAFTPTGVTYTPAADYSGPDAFTYTVSDGNGGTATGTVTVTVSAVNDPPTAAADALTVAEDDGPTVVDVLASDTPAPDAGEVLTVVAVTQPGSGTVTLAGGVVRYTPGANFFGTDSFTYTVSDGNGGTATATVAVTVTPVNDPPTVNPDTLVVSGDGPAGAVDVLANDSTAPDPDETLTVTAVTQGSHGAVTLIGGVVRYAPAAGYSGPDAFTYTVSDGSGGTVTAAVDVTVTPAPPPPPPAAAAQPAAVGGLPDGSALALTPSDGKYGVGPTLDFFPGAGVTVRVAVADVTGDGVPDYVGGAGPGGLPQVAVLDGKTGATVATFLAFEATFTGGVLVAAADLDGDGKAEVIATPDRGGGPVVTMYSGSRLSGGLTADAAQVVRFFGIDDPAFRGGARAALGDVNGDGTPDLVVSAGFLGGPRIAVFDGRDLAAGSASPGRLVSDFFAFEPTLRNGAFVAAGDVTGDGKAELAFGGGPGGAPRVRLFDGAGLLAAGSFPGLDAVPGAQLANFFAGDGSLRGGVRVLLRDADGDGKADLVTGSGEGEPSRVRVYESGTLLADPVPAPDQELDPYGAALAGGVFVG